MNSDPSPVVPASGQAASSQVAALDQALVALCASVLPVWARHLATSRTQSEAAVFQMISAFSEIGPHLKQAQTQSCQISAALRLPDAAATSLLQACQNELFPLLDGLAPGPAAALQRVLALVQHAVQAIELETQTFTHETEIVAVHVEQMYAGFQYQDRISQMISLLHEDILRLQALLLAPGSDAAALQTDNWLARLESQYAMEEQRLNHGAAGSTPATATDDKEMTFF